MLEFGRALETYDNGKEVSITAASRWQESKIDIGKIANYKEMVKRKGHNVKMFPSLEVIQDEKGIIIQYSAYSMA